MSAPAILEPVMTALAQEAATQSVLLQLGVISAQGVIDWATDIRQREGEKAAPGIIELSTTPATRLDLIGAALHRLQRESDYWPAVRAALAKAYAFLLVRPDESRRVARALYALASKGFPEVPEDLNFMYYMDDAFVRARAGARGTEDDARLDLLLELAKFKQP